MTTSDKLSAKANGAIIPPLLASVRRSVQPALGISTYVSQVSPEQAYEWLANHNKGNRNLRESVWRRYASDMKHGRWVLNGEAIVFDANGNLVDGQHRLRACFESGVAFDSLVVRGVEPRAFDTMDSGLGRQTADAVRDLKNAACVSAAAKLGWVHDHFGINRLTNSDCRPTRSQEIEYIRSNEPQLVVAAEKSVNVKRLVAPSVAAFCHFVFHRQDAAAADRFHDDLMTGINLDATNPVRHLRERLINRDSKSKLVTQHTVALFFRAWIAYRDNRPMKQLKYWRTDGPNPEQFPDISTKADRK